MIWGEQKAEELWQATVKKFSHDPQVWQRFAQYYFRRGQKEEARALLTRSLKSLSKRQRAYDQLSERSSLIVIRRR